MSSPQKKMWYAMVMRQMPGFPHAIVSTIIQPVSNNNWSNSEESTPQSLTSMDRSEIVGNATLHAAQLKDRIVELKNAKWTIEILEVSPTDIHDIPRIVEIINL